MNLIPLLIRLSAAGVLASFASVSMALPGDVDANFNPNAGGRVLSTVMQGGGKILVAGDFNSMGGQPRDRIARLNPDGTPDPVFAPVVNGSVTCMAVQADGGIIIGGDFSTVGGQARQRLVRLNEDGSLDESFNPGVSGGSSPYLHCMALQADGKLLIGGSFTSVGGTGRSRIARLNADGTLDTAFNPGANGTVRTIAIQADGKIVAGGQFGTFAGGTRGFIARVAADGALDADFDTGMNSYVNCLAVQKDGKIIVGGEFNMVGTVTRNFAARLDSGGDPETGFDPAPSAPVRCLAIQTDGKIFLGGDFQSLGTTSRNRLARLGPDGVPDATFIPNAGSTVYSVTLQADGKVVAGGNFTSFGGQSRNRLARLDNDSATDTLTIPTVSRVQWQRGGSSAETLRVIFQMSAEEGDPWAVLGPGVRTTGGWELTGLTLPATGRIRALASTTGGQYGGSAGMVESVKPFLFEPEIAVEQPAGTSLVAGTATVNFGAVLVGASKTLTFTIRNTGLHNLTGLEITPPGNFAPDFAASTPVATVAAGSSTTFTVTFTGSLAITRNAVLRLTSNDTNENPFEINLTARALDPNADDDSDGMTNAAEVMLAGSGFDPLVNSAAKITQLRAAGVFPASDIQALSLTQLVLERNAATGHFLLRIGVEKSPDMSAWTPLPETVDFDIPGEGAGPFFYRVFGKRP